MSEKARASRFLWIVNALRWRKRACAVWVLCAMTAIALPAQTFTTRYSFCAQGGCADGELPYAALIQATNGNLYGTTGYGGTNPGLYGNGGGTVFKITPSGKLTTLYNFCAQGGCVDGEAPIAGLVQVADGAFYGTTSSGGAYGYGTVFRITPSGALTTLYSFCAQSGCTDGEDPMAGLVQATNGDLYGTTWLGGAGGANCTQTPGAGCGTIFKITPSGKLTTLYDFCSQSGCADGQGPYAGLIQATNGDLYGTTWGGGAYGYGTIFNIAASGKLTTLYSFSGSDGEGPEAGLIQATDGNLYGTTYGGANGNPMGTVFKITPSGALTTLYSFCAQSGCTDGEVPVAGLGQDTNGTFYGATWGGGAYGYGTVFSLSVGLGQFVKTLPTSARVGSAVRILGTNLTGATSVTFNGTAAAFTVVSRYLITATVPTGATTGKVEVVTPSGTLSSNVPFRVP